MRKYIFIGCGSFFGAVLRVLIRNLHIPHYYGIIPLNTLFINLTGTFLIALLFTVAYQVWNFDSDIRLGLTTGFLGAFTTFSTLCKEAAGLLQEGHYITAMVYLAGSILLGLGAAYLGALLARGIGSRIKKTKKKKESDVI